MSLAIINVGTATHSTEMEHRALLAMVSRGPDEAAAAAVTAFPGDINACPVDETVLHVAVYCGRPLTIAALAARGDCNPNIAPRLKGPVLCSIASWYSSQMDMATFLAHFPTLDVDACNSAGYTPLHYIALNNHDTNVRLLLDAGADPTIRTRTRGGHTPAELARMCGRTRCTELLEAAEAWHSGLRRAWLRAVVCVSENIAV